LAVVFIPQFILFMFMFLMLGHIKVAVEVEVAVETTDARLAPGSEQLYGGVQYNSTEPHQLYQLYMFTVLFSSALTTTTFESTQAKSKTRWTGFRIKSPIFLATPQSTLVTTPLHL
jgi:hypothetical protein